VRRRAVITLLGGAAAWPLAARAPQRPKVWRVGCLFASSASDIVVSYFEAFKTKLGELGYVEGQNLIVDVRRAEGNFSRLAGLAADLVALHPDAILAVAMKSAKARNRVGR
jgi:putative ABC transport system substrate-binding protein